VFPASNQIAFQSKAHHCMYLVTLVYIAFLLLNFDPINLIYELYPEILEAYLHTSSELSGSKDFKS